MQLTRLEELAQTYSDLYKDVNGFRPRGYADLNEAQLEADIARLEAELVEVVAQERQAQDAAAARFEQRVKDTIATGAGDRDTAIRWIDQAEGADGDREYLCYLLGLRYGYFAG